MIDPKFFISNVQNDWKYILEKERKFRSKYEKKIKELEVTY